VQRRGEELAAGDVWTDTVREQLVNLDDIVVLDRGKERLVVKVAQVGRTKQPINVLFDQIRLPHIPGNK